MAHTHKKLPPAKRIALHRQRAERLGVRRVEVAVPAADVCHIRAFARALREGGTLADRLRIQGEQIEHPAIASTGAALVALLGQRDGFRIELPPRTIEGLRDTGF